MGKFVETMYDAITLGMEKEFPQRVAFRYYTEETDTVTTVLFKELAQDVRRTVTYLQNTIPDVKGKKVCLLSKNSYEYVVNTFGAIMAGCVLVPMNQRKSWAELSHELELVEPAAILTDGEDYGNKEQLEAAYGSLLRPMDDFRRYEPAAELHPIGHDDLMVLMFTSGTTGLSKGVMMSERNLFSAGNVLWAISAQLEDKISQKEPLPGHYMVLPMFHLGAFIDLFSTTVMGWPLNLGNDIRNFYRDIQKMPSQVMSVVPMIMNSLHKDVMPAGAAGYGAQRDVRHPVLRRYRDLRCRYHQLCAGRKAHWRRGSGQQADGLQDRAGRRAVHARRLRDDGLL